MSVAFVDLPWQGRSVRIEHQWVGGHAATGAGAAAHGAEGAPIVFLHEGLGSLAMWRDFPARLCAATGRRGLVVSRPGHGRSTPRAPDETWGVDFLHRQAHELLPALLHALGVRRPPWLFGHSDGGSIALLYAARLPTAGAIVLAPHTMVEELSVASIKQARTAYLTGDLRQRLARHHDDPDSAFWGWNGAWLHPDFRRWDIGAEIAGITCPLLAVQGLDDVYGTLEQIRGIARRLPHTQLLELPACGHAPHKDQPEVVLQACAAFIRTHGGTPALHRLPTTAAGPAH